MYIELHCHSAFSLLDGATLPEDLLARAFDLGMPALALTDHDALYGAPRFARAAEALGIRPVFGAELTTDRGHLTLLAADSAGWANLSQLITLARRDEMKGSARLPWVALEGRSEGLIALSGCRLGPVAAPLLKHDPDSAQAATRDLMRLFPGRLWIELQNHLRPGDDHLVDRLAGLAEHLGLPIVATNNVHYARREGQRLQDVLVCIRERVTLDSSARLRRPNSEYYLKGADRMAPLFRKYPQAITSSALIAAQCDYRPQAGVQDLPEFPGPEGQSAGEVLQALCLEALPARCDDLDAARERLQLELSIIERAGLANYFLIVWDLVRWAREQRIRCQGRGSAAGSLVAYLLYITPINPLEHGLVFERFLSDERQLTPDIDIDFDAARREEVIQYLYQRYGAAHTAMACTFITFRARSAIREVGQALGLDPALIDRAARAVGWGSASEAIEEIGGSPEENRLIAQLIDLTGQIRGLPRHLGIQNGGMLITGPPLNQRVPLEPATMPDRVVAQWDKEGLEDAGLVKIDILGLRMLSVLSDSSRMVGVDLEALRFDDPAVYGLISSGETVGVFQVESRAQAQLQPRLKPRHFRDLIVAISLIRPGPIQGQMVHPYLRRREGIEPLRYLHPDLIPALEETLGVILYQEQVLKVARDLAGFSPGQGELLRRALGSKHGTDLITTMERVFIDGASRRGVSESVSREVYAQLAAFAGYAFPKSHAAAFAVLVYQSAWMKLYHPAAFFAALLNNQPMGFWSPAVLVNEARRRAVIIRGVDLLHSAAAACLEADGAIRVGLMQVDGLGEEAAGAILAARDAGPFRGLSDLRRRAGLSKRLIERLILAGACDAWGPRRNLLWELGRLPTDPTGLDLPPGPLALELPPLESLEAQGMERDVLGLSVGDHPLLHLRPWLKTHGVLSSRALRLLPDGDWARVAGLAVIHQAPPTAKGIHFITLEDEEGLVDLVLHPPVYARYRVALRGARLILAGGRVQRSGTVVNLQVERMQVR